MKIRSRENPEIPSHERRTFFLPNLCMFCINVAYFHDFGCFAYTFHVLHNTIYLIFCIICKWCIKYRNIQFDLLSSGLLWLTFGERRLEMLKSCSLSIPRSTSEVFACCASPLMYKPIVQVNSRCCSTAACSNQREYKDIFDLQCIMHWHWQIAALLDANKSFSDMHQS